MKVGMRGRRCVHEDSPRSRMLRAGSEQRVPGTLALWLVRGLEELLLTPQEEEEERSETHRMSLSALFCWNYFI